MANSKRRSISAPFFIYLSGGVACWYWMLLGLLKIPNFNRNTPFYITDCSFFFCLSYKTQSKKNLQQPKTFFLFFLFILFCTNRIVHLR